MQTDGVLLRHSSYPAVTQRPPDTRASAASRATHKTADLLLTNKLCNIHLLQLHLALCSTHLSHHLDCFNMFVTRHFKVVCIRVDF